MKKVAILVAEGFEDVEAVVVGDFCERAGIEVELLSITDKMQVRSAHGVKFKCDKLVWEAKTKKYDLVYLPGGLEGAKNLKASKDVKKFILKALEEDKIVAGLCAAPMVLDHLDLLEDGKFTCYPGLESEFKAKPDLSKTLVKNGNIWTGMGPMFAPEMAFAIIEELKGEEASKKVQEETLYNRLKEEISK